MITSIIGNLNQQSVSGRTLRSSLVWVIWFGLIMGLSAFLGLLLWRGGPDISLIFWMFYIAGAVLIFYRPRYGLYLIIFFGLLGDGLLIPWYPFVKNFSSVESLLYLHDSIIVSPLESYILLTFVSWLGRDLFQRKVRFFAGPLFWPAILFMLFLIFGLIFGIATGGNLNIALWESRSIFYLIAMIVLTSNLLETRAQVSNLMWAAMLAIFLEGVIGNWYFIAVLRRSLAGVDAITEHAAALHMNTLFVFVLAVWFYQGSTTKRLALPLMVPFVALTYLATQRRAAFLSLAIALVMMAVVLYLENRRLFWWIFPPAAFVALVYLAVFWNSGGALGLPAQAVKSVIATDQASAADQTSNLYRAIENVNTSYTIHQRPFTGVGFGQKFYIIVPLPDISFFSWWEYLPHNSIIWIWLKTGLGGFLVMLFLVGLAIMVGMRAFRRMPPNDLRAIALTATLYIVMHFVYAYVDISWDVQSMLYVGAMMGVLNSLERIVAKPVPIRPVRWSWQPVSDPEPLLLSISTERES